MVNMKSLSLKTQILVLVMTLVSIALGLLIIITISQIKNQLRTSIEQKAVSICTITAESVGPGLEFQDSSFISDYARGAFADEDVIGICICNETEKSVFRNIRGNLINDFDIACPASITDTITISHFGNYCGVSRAVTSRGKIVGDIWLVLSTESVSDRIKSSIKLIFLITFLILFLIILVGSFMARRIVRPIGLFEEASDKIRKGEMFSSIEISPLGKDFKSLGIAFNEMSAELESTFEKLHESKAHLEDKVQQRTRDLQQELAERKRAELALEESDQKIKNILDNVGIGITLISPKMEILSLNKKMREWFPHIEAMEKPICYEVFNLPSRSDVCKYCPTHLTLKDGLTHESITEILRGEEIRYHRIISTPMRNIKGEVTCAIAMIEDITGQKRDEFFRKNRSDFLRKLVGQNEVAEIAALAFNYLSTLMPYDAGMLILYNSSDTRSSWEMVFSLDTGDDGNKIIDDIRKQIYPAAGSQFKKVVLEKKMRVIHRNESQYNEALAKKDNAFGDINRVSRSSAYFPLLIKGQAVGAMNVQSYQADFFDQDRVTILDLVGVDLAMALDAIIHQEATRKSEENYRLLFSEMSSGFALHEIIYDENGEPYDYRYLEINPAFEKLTGFKVADIIGKTIREIMPDNEPQWIDVFGQVTLTGQSAHVEDYIEALDRYYDAIAYCPQPGRFAVVFNEITERKRAEEALRESEAKYRTLFDTANDAIFIIQGDRFIDCNVHTLEMFGCRWEEIVGETPQMFSPVCQPDGIASKDKAREKIKAAMEGIPQSFEWLHCKLDRTPFYAEINLSRMEFNNGTFLLAIVRDITERKKAEEQKRSFQEKLERAERMESLGILAGGIAHDLNNMLGPLVGYPDLMLMKLPDNSPLRKQIERIGRAAQGAADVVQDLLTLARRGRYEMVSIDINDIVEAYLDSPGFVKLTEKHQDVKTVINLQKPIGHLSGSFHHLLKVFMNLIVNAFDAMPDGGELTIESKQQHVEKLASGFEKIEKGDYIILSVRDTGMGIDPKDFAKIFEPYYSKKKMGTSGSGLGLSVVYGIVKDHKAYYDILSDVGKGTEFILYFPVGDDKIKQDTATATQEIYGAETILVVDDIEEQREMAAELLASMNYQVATARNGREAVKYLRNHQVDLVMLDMIMENDFDGLDTYREVIKIHPGQKALVVSGFSATDRVQEMKRLGAGEYIKKPYTRETLGRAVRNTLNREIIVQNLRIKTPKL